MRTHGTKEHETGEGDDPEILEVDCIAAIELEEPGLDVWVGGRSIK